VNSQEIKRLKRYEKEIDQRKVLWIENTVGMFDMQVKRYQEYIKSSLKGERFDEEQFKRDNTKDPILEEVKEEVKEEE